MAFSYFVILVFLHLSSANEITKLELLESKFFTLEKNFEALSKSHELQGKKPTSYILKYKAAN